MRIKNIFKKTACASMLVSASVLLMSAGAFAGIGTNYCPPAESFKYNNQNGQMEAPGGWATTDSTHKVAVTSFVKAEAISDGQVYACIYNVVFKNKPSMLFVQADDYYYVADDIKNIAVWQKGSNDMVCVSSDPQKCKFHRQN